MILQILLYSYLITTGINLLIMPIRAYRIEKKELGKRLAIFETIRCSLVCFIPYISFIVMIYSLFIAFKEKVKNWIDKDPTAPRNINDPDFVPPPKKEKKFEPITSREEILDL